MDNREGQGLLVGWDLSTGLWVARVRLRAHLNVRYESWNISYMSSNFLFGLIGYLAVHGCSAYLEWNSRDTATLWTCSWLRGTFDTKAAPSYSTCSRNFSLFWSRSPNHTYPTILPKVNLETRSCSFSPAPKQWRRDLTPVTFNWSLTPLTSCLHHLQPLHMTGYNLNPLWLSTTKSLGLWGTTLSPKQGFNILLFSGCICIVSPSYDFCVLCYPFEKLDWQETSTLLVAVFLPYEIHALFIALLILELLYSLSEIVCSHTHRPECSFFQRNVTILLLQVHLLKIQGGFQPETLIQG